MGTRDFVVQKIVRPERTVSGTWLEVIASNLDYHRATFLWKCEGLSDAQLRLRPLGSSELTLLGLMRHLQGVERALVPADVGRYDSSILPVSDLRHR
ncbi:DUF664 domain-containing protein [Streptomyces sp. L7]